MYNNIETHFTINLEDSNYFIHTHPTKSNMIESNKIKLL